MKEKFFSIPSSRMWEITVVILLWTVLFLIILPEYLTKDLVRISPILLIVVTAIYVIETRRMTSFMEKQSAIMAKEFELRISPILHIEGICSFSSINEIQHAFTVENFGEFPIVINKVDFKFTSPYQQFIEKTSGSGPVNKTIFSGGKIRLPHILIFKQEKKVEILKMRPIGVRIDVDSIQCTVTYTDMQQKEYELVGLHEGKFGVWIKR